MRKIRCSKILLWRWCCGVTIFYNWSSYTLHDCSLARCLNDLSWRAKYFNPLIFRYTTKMHQNFCTPQWQNGSSNRFVRKRSRVLAPVERKII